MVWWTLQNTALAVALAAIVQIACRLGRVGPVGRHALWLIVLVKLVTPPILVLHSPWTIPMVSALLPVSTVNVDRDVTIHGVDGPGALSRPAPGAASTQPTVLPQLTAAGVSVLDEGTAASRVSMTSVHAARESRIAIVRRAMSYVASGFSRTSTPIWMAGALVFALVQGVRIRRVVRSLRRASPPTPELAAAVQLCQRRLGIRSIRVSVVPDLVSPMIWSANPFRPRLLWPAELSPRISEECRRALIVHELAHLKRCDHWVGWLELAAGCAQWWNPLFWFVRSRLRENAELACDGWVVNELPHGRRAYADALLMMCARMGALRAPMTVIGITTGGRRLLERRLAMIMQDHIPLRLSRTAALSVVACTLVALPAWAQRAQPLPIVPAASVAPEIQAVRLDAIPPGSVPSMPLATEPRGSRGQTAPSAPAPTREPAIALVADAAYTFNLLQQPAPVVAPAQAPTVSAQSAASDGAAVWRLSLDDALKLNETISLRAAGNPAPAAVRSFYWHLVYAVGRVEVTQQALANEAGSEHALSLADASRRNFELSLKRLIVSGTADPNWFARIDPTDRAVNLGPVDVVSAIRRALGDAPPVDPRDAAAVAERRAAELRVAQDVTQGAIAVANYGDAIRGARIVRVDAEQRLLNEQRKFEAGGSTNYPVVQAMRDLTNARSAELRAILNYRRAQVEFEQLQETGPAQLTR